MVFAVTNQPGRIRHHNIHISNQIRASSLPSPLLFHRKWVNMEMISYEWRVFFKVYMKVWNGRVKSHIKHLNSENSLGPHMRFVQKDQWHHKKTRNSCHVPILTFLCSSWQLTINKIKKKRKERRQNWTKITRVSEYDKILGQIVWSVFLLLRACLLKIQLLLNCWQCKKCTFFISQYLCWLSTDETKWI